MLQHDAYLYASQSKTVRTGSNDNLYEYAIYFLSFKTNDITVTSLHLLQKGMIIIMTRSRGTNAIVS